MNPFFEKLFSAKDYMPHGHCYVWHNDVLWLNVLSDGLIFASYLTIPFILFYFVKKRKDLVFNWIFIMFGLFILGCGFTHFMDIVTVWNPVYGISGLVKLFTGIVSFSTAILLFRLVPRALAIPSPSQLKTANIALQKEVVIREEAEANLRIRSEALERTNLELERFAYVASHDLKEPLRMVSSYTQLLARRYGEKLDDQGLEYIGYAVDGVKRMQALIDDLLNYARIDKEDAVKEEVNLNQVLQTTLQNMQTTISETNAEIKADNLPVVQAVAHQMVELFQNLIGNGLKFKKDNETPVIKITSEELENEWKISIADNGIGFHQQYAERVFVLFQRLHNRHSYPGTGIGLAICKKIVEEHKGKIWVESEETIGTSFHFTLPK